MKIVECVPNFSEGRRPEVIRAIRSAAEAVQGITVLDCENDADHNRMVLTFVGPPDAVKLAALEASAVAISCIDLRSHTGEHPRMGAVDVVPFVPLREITMEECAQLAKEFAEAYSSRFAVPVFLYEFAARRPERKDLAKVREGQFEGLRELIGKDPSREPDYGPNVIHPSAGATAVGARPILIAYNVNLASNDLAVAKKIAHYVRGRDGGLPTVKALGFDLKDRSIVQVSMNLTDYKVTSVSRAFEQVSKHAKNLGVSVLESEIVGLVPLDALTETAVSYLKLTNFHSNQIIENRLFNLAESLPEKKEDLKENSPDYPAMTLKAFTESVSSREPTPGGGTVAAVTGSLAAALLIMVCRLTKGKKGYEGVQHRIAQIETMAQESKVQLLNLANRDSEAYSRVSRALGLPKSIETEKAFRKESLNIALQEATRVPAQTMLESVRVLKLANELLQIGNKNARSDAETSVELARASARSAWSNVKLNLESLAENHDFADQVQSELRLAIQELER